MSLEEDDLSTPISMSYLRMLFQDRNILANFPKIFFTLDNLLEKEICRAREKIYEYSGVHKNFENTLPKATGSKTTQQEKIYVPSPPVSNRIDNQSNNKSNVVGHLLGPEGSTAKYIEDCFGVRIMIRGKGSMRDCKQEEINFGKPSWEHLNDPLHILILAEDSENRVSLRIDAAKQCVSKLIEYIPEDDLIKQMQLIELASNREFSQRTILSTSESRHFQRALMVDTHGLTTTTSSTNQNANFYDTKTLFDQNGQGPYGNPYESVTDTTYLPVFYYTGSDPQPNSIDSCDGLTQSHHECCFPSNTTPSVGFHDLDIDRSGGNLLSSQFYQMSLGKIDPPHPQAQPCPMGYAGSLGLSQSFAQTVNLRPPPINQLRSSQSLGPPVHQNATQNSIYFNCLLGSSQQQINNSSSAPLCMPKSYVQPYDHQVQHGSVTTTWVEDIKTQSSCQHQVSSSSNINDTTGSDTQTVITGTDKAGIIKSTQNFNNKTSSDLLTTSNFRRKKNKSKATSSHHAKLKQTDNSKN